MNDLADSLAFQELKLRVDSLEREFQDFRRAGPPGMQSGPAPASVDMQTFARQLIQQIGAELDAMRPQDDGKTLGAMEGGVLHDGKGVALARYGLPDGQILIWARTDEPPGFAIKVIGANGAAVSYERKTT